MSGVFQRLQESLNEAKESATRKINDVTTTNEKILDMYPNTVNVRQDKTMTTDFGTKINDGDHWLKVVGKEGHGPSLLEDQIARERVSPRLLGDFDVRIVANVGRYLDSPM